MTVNVLVAPLAAPHRDDVLLPQSAVDGTPANDLESCFAFALFAQSLALLRSLSVGVRPDSPNAAGTVSRVVKGVSIYPWHGAR